MNRGPAVLIVALCIAGLSGCVGHLAPEPGVFKVSDAKVQLADRTVRFTCVTPEAAHPPAFLILYATGDAGWLGASRTVFAHMAERGYYVAGYSSRDFLKATKASGENITLAEGTIGLGTMIDQAKQALGLPATTPTILTGVSRGASMVVFGAANRTLQPGLAGAVAMALTREADYLPTPDPALHLPGIETDEKGRIQIYPAISRVGSLPIAVIQSAGDSYVPAAEARELFGPDTPTRRLYAVDASNHGFSGGRDELLRDLDEALTWITSMPPREAGPPR